MKVKPLAIVALMLWAIASSADEVFPTLEANGQVYSNATVFRVTATDIFFYSAQGAGNIKMKDLDPALQNHFLTGAPVNAPVEQKPDAPKKQIFNYSAPKIIPGGQKILAAASLAVTLTVAGVLLIFYFFLCYCFKRICEKCEVVPGILVWIPIFNVIRMLQVAGLSGWLFLLFFVPIANIVMSVVMWAKICQACGKSPWLVLMMLVPVINLLFIPYLAFSQPGEAAASSDQSLPRQKIVIGS